MEYPFILKGRRMVATVRQIEAALEGVPPEKVRVRGVEIGGQVYPVVQAFAVAFGLDHADCRTDLAHRVFRHLGFTVSPGPPEAVPKAARSKAKGRRPGESQAAYLRRALPHRSPEIGPPEEEFLQVPPIHLPWSPWERWEDIFEHGWAIIDLPFGKAGVYEARLEDHEERLAIGRAGDLRKRVMLGLVRGTTDHPAGQKIRKHENVYQILIRWAVTDRPAAAEEELHHRHIARFGRLPKYTGHT